MSTIQHTPSTATEQLLINVHVDRPAEWSHEGLQFEDTNGEPIAIWSQDEWLVCFSDLINFWGIGGTLDMTDDEVQALAREVLSHD